MPKHGYERTLTIKRQDLMKVYYIEIELAEWKEELQKMQETVVPKLFSGGKALGRKDVRRSRAEDAAISLAEIEHKIQLKIAELERAKSEIITFIMGIDDPLFRVIIKLRCLDCLTWNQVADKLGGGNTEYSVKKMFYRYLDKKGI